VNATKLTYLHYKGRRKIAAEQPNNGEWKKRRWANIAPLNYLPLLPSGPGGVQQELVVSPTGLQR